MRRILLTSVVGSALLVGGVALAQRPKENISPGRHPNLAAAQRLCRWDLGGHAKKAKELLDQASEELKAAAEAANRR